MEWKDKSLFRLSIAFFKVMHDSMNRKNFKINSGPSPEESFQPPSCPPATAQGEHTGFVISLQYCQKKVKTFSKFPEWPHLFGPSVLVGMP